MIPNLVPCLNFITQPWPVYSTSWSTTTWTCFVNFPCSLFAISYFCLQHHQRYEEAPPLNSWINTSLVFANHSNKAMYKYIIRTLRFEACIREVIVFSRSLTPPETCLILYVRSLIFTCLFSCCMMFTDTPPFVKPLDLKSWNISRCTFLRGYGLCYLITSFVVGQSYDMIFIIRSMTFVYALVLPYFIGILLYSLL